MRKLIAVAVLISTTTFAADPAPADAPLITDLAGVSVHLDQGQPAPFSGRLLSDEENLRRGKKAANDAATLANAEANGVLLPKAAVATLISVAAAAVISSITLGIVLAAKK